MLLKEVSVGTDIIVQAIVKDKSREFTTRIIGVEGDVVKLAPIVEYDLFVNFNCDNVEVTLFVQVDEKTLYFNDIRLRTGRDVNNNKFYFVSGKKESEIVNRRQTPRYLVNKTCSFTLGEHRKVVDAVMQDVSITGFSILTDEEVEVGAKVRAAFTIDSSRNQMILDAYVKNVREVGRGIRRIYGCELLREHNGFSKFVMQRQREKIRIRK